MRLPEMVGTNLTDSCKQTSRNPTVRKPNQPCFTVTANALFRPCHSPKAFIVEPLLVNSAFPGSNGKKHYTSKEPAFTVDTTTLGRAKAFIVDGQNARTPKKGGLNCRSEDEPTFTISASSSERRAWLNQGRVVAMTSRALARFQSFPDSYQLPEKNQLACRVIGNAVPPLLAQQLLAAIAQSQEVAA